MGFFWEYVSHPSQYVILGGKPERGSGHQYRFCCSSDEAISSPPRCCPTIFLPSSNQVEEERGKGQSSTLEANGEKKRKEEGKAWSLLFLPVVIRVRKGSTSIHSRQQMTGVGSSFGPLAYGAVCLIVELSVLGTVLPCQDTGAVQGIK